jgi:hypothetical protein
MTKNAAMTKLIANGYKVTWLYQGGCIASKRGISYKAETINGLINIIFK